MGKREKDIGGLIDVIRAVYRDPDPFHFSDDMDDWLGLQGMTTYTEQAAIRYRENQQHRSDLRKELWELGAEALPDVRKALKGLGRWREILVEFLEEFGGSEEDREVLRLVAMRRREVLDADVRKLLQKWGESTKHLVPAPRTTPTPSQLAKEDRLAQLVELCRTPTPVRAMMGAIDLRNRRNFNNNYLVELRLRKLIESCESKGRNRDCYLATDKGLRWLRKRKG